MICRHTRGVCDVCSPPYGYPQPQYAPQYAPPYAQPAYAQPAYVQPAPVYVERYGRRGILSGGLLGRPRGGLISTIVSGIMDRQDRPSPPPPPPMQSGYGYNRGMGDNGNDWREPNRYDASRDMRGNRDEEWREQDRERSRGGQDRGMERRRSEEDLREGEKGGKLYREKEREVQSPSYGSAPPPYEGNARR
ncbi:hypothetical protein B7494_g7165 [Chlorociboria aeruginascens]|nr:hypothetical protein B7494_g7165 [Chlorociboria aeruginascens]